MRLAEDILLRDRHHRPRERAQERAFRAHRDVLPVGHLWQHGDVRSFGQMDPRDNVLIYDLCDRRRVDEDHFVEARLALGDEPLNTQRVGQFKFGMPAAKQRETRLETHRDVSPVFRSEHIGRGNVSNLVPVANVVRTPGEGRPELQCGTANAFVRQQKIHPGKLPLDRRRVVPDIIHLPEVDLAPMGDVHVSLHSGPAEQWPRQGHVQLHGVDRERLDVLRDTKRDVRSPLRDRTTPL
mmetsp:Transcript_8979/g.24184  ORF Transcript_8979/g.24184 Transcript_8979/m.24184 type:complete len:239 (+) Transcript_8979:1488-2204(+)